MMNTIEYNHRNIPPLGFILVAMLILALTGKIKAQEVCYDRIDNDGDGLIDCLDSDCTGDTTCWECLSEFYQVHSNSDMVILYPDKQTYGKLADISGASSINAEAFNVVDGHVYAAAMVGGNHRLVRLNNNGTVVDLGLSLPGSSQFYVGVIDTLGVYYVSAGSTVYEVDLTDSTLSATSTSLSNNGVADLAYNRSTGLLYGIKSNSNTMSVLDPTSGKVNSVSLSGKINTESGAFGAAWSSKDGSMYFSNNKSGNIYNITLANGYASVVLTATGNLRTNDGFNCIDALPPVESGCNNGIDDDGDGKVDCADSDCYQSFACNTEVCYNGYDDDGDGYADCDDSDCASDSICLQNVGSGANGGLESNNRLASKIAVRNFQRSQMPVNELDIKGMQLQPSNYSLTGRSFKNLPSIQEFIPVDVLSNTSTHVATPDDLPQITNAEDVFSVDVYKDEIRVASVLGIETTDGVYEHSKYICERVHGSSVDRIYTQIYEGNEYVCAELTNSDGVREFTTSFALIRKGDGTFAYENHWNLNSYSTEGVFYNFQIWSQSKNALNQLYKAIINKVELKSINEGQGDMPLLFVQNGNYSNGELKLRYVNRTEDTIAYIRGNIKHTETASSEPFTQEIRIPAMSSGEFVLHTGTLFETGFEFYSTNSMGSDLLYFADGSWAYDFLEYAGTINSFDVSTGLAVDNGKSIERNVSVTGTVKQEVAIFRGLNPSFKAEDLSQFNTLNFIARGSGLLRVSVQHQNRNGVAVQPYTDVLLTDEITQIQLRKDQFIHMEAEDWKDVTALVFTMIGNGETYEPFELELQNISFTLEGLSSVEEILESKAFTPSPNPALNNTTFSISGNVGESYQIELYSSEGVILKTISGSLMNGQQNVSVDLSELPKGSILYKLNLKNHQPHSGIIIHL